MQNLEQNLRKLYVHTITVLSLVFILGLAILAAYGTSQLAGSLAYETADSILLNIITAIFPVFVIVFLKKVPRVSLVLKRIEKDDIQFSRLRNILFYLLMIQGIIWVCSTQFIPDIDQKNILNAAHAIRLGDLGMYSPGGYMNNYPHQMGMVLFCWALSFIVGSWNFLAFQMLNAVFYALIWRSLADISGYFGMSRGTQLGIPLLGMFFTPLLFYCSYVYGIIPGLGLALLAIRSTLRWFETEKQFHAVAAGLFFGISVFLKENYLIFAIGVLIFSVMEALRLKKRRAVIVILWILVFLVGFKTVSKSAFQRLNSSDQAQGISRVAWIAMGLQDDGGFYPGGFNYYNEYSYSDSGYNTQVQSSVAFENILSTLNDFSTGKRDAAEFFLRKISLQWNNPTFMSFWIVRMMSSVMEESNWLWSIKDVVGMNNVLRFLNPLQFSLLFGAAIYIFSCRDNKEYERSLLLLMIFCGGFIFHIFWESRAEYALPYYVLLFPYAVAGYRRAIQCTDSILFHTEEKMQGKTVAGSAVIAAVLIVCTGAVFLTALGKTAVLRASTEEYSQYLYAREVTRQPYFSSYKTEIVPFDNADDTLWYHTLPNTSSSLLIDAEDRDVIEMVSVAGKNRLRIARRLYITAQDDGTVTISPYVDNHSQIWHYLPCANDTYAIVNENNMALTMLTDGSIHLLPFTGDEKQSWYFR